MEDKQSGRWPRRLTIRMVQVVYLAIAGSSLGWLVRLPLVQRVKYRIAYTPAWRVLELLDLLASAEVRAWLAGGWGVDALLGRQTRPHCDIDLVISDDGSSYERVAEVLGREGFRFSGTYHHPGIPIPWCNIWRHDAGHKVEVLPVPLHEQPFTAEGADGRGAEQPFAEGSIDGRPVPCLSAELQFLLHDGYPQREIDNHDVALLRAYLGVPERRTVA